MNELRERRWLRYHAMAAPFGIFAATALLVVRSGQWEGWESLGLAADMVDLGAVLYAMIAVLAERGVDMVFWALEQKRKREQEREQRQAEFRKRLMAEGHAVGLAEGRAEAWREFEVWLERIKEEKGIDIDELPPR